jgi:hypothetical protein
MGARFLAGGQDLEAMPLFDDVPIEAAEADDQQKWNADEITCWGSEHFASLALAGRWTAGLTIPARATSPG